MATTPTQTAVPSELPQDLKFNAGKIDEFVTSSENEYIDRKGGKHRTIAGINYDANQAMLNYGYITQKSFEIGATLDTPNTVLQWESNGEYYRWDGDWSQPKVVPPGSTPESTGGIGPGKWIGVGDASLRADLTETTKIFDDFTEAKSSMLQRVFGCIVTNGRITKGDGGGGEFYRDGTGTPGDTDGGSYFVTADGSKFVLSGSANIKQFGGVPGGNYPTALTSLISYASARDKVLRIWSDTPVIMPFSNITKGIFNGFTLDVSSTVTISAPNDDAIKSPLVKVVRPVHIYCENIKSDFYLRDDYSLTAGDFTQADPAQITNANVTDKKRFFIDIEDKEEQILGDFTATPAWRTVNASWAAGAFSAVTPASKDAGSCTLNLSNGVLSAALFSKFTVGSELICSMFPDNMPLSWSAAIVECDGFRYVYREQPNGQAFFMATALGGTPAESGIQYVGRNTHGSQWQRNSMVSIRVNTAQSFTILTNGIERVTVENTAGIIREIGFGAVGLNTSTSETIGLWYPMLVKNRKYHSTKPLNLMVVGDSITDANVADGWPQYMNQMLEGCHGIRVQNVRTIAVSGYNSSQIKPLYDAENLGGIDCIVFQIGVNDIQGQVLPGTLYTNIYNMLKRANDIGIKCVVSIPTQFYTQVQAAAITGITGHGQNSVNYDKGGVRRAAVARAALVRNQEVGSKINLVNTGSLDDLGPIVAEYLLNNKDPIAYDNIHPSSYGRILLGMSNAKAVASHMFGKDKRDIEYFAPGWGKNGWSTATTNPLVVKVHGDGRVSFFGNLSSNASTNTTDGTIVCNIPAWMAPIRAKRFIVEKQNDNGTSGGTGVISIDNTGNISIYGIGSYNAVMDGVILQ